MRPHTLKITYTSGRTEVIERVSGVELADKNSATLAIYGEEIYLQRDLIKTIVLANVESYEWVLR